MMVAMRTTVVKGSGLTPYVFLAGLGLGHTP
jgi:hypothetical protein